MATKEQKELPELIGAFFISWEAARATDAAIAGVAAGPQHSPEDCAVRLGAIDSLGQAVGITRGMALKALACYLEPISNGNVIYSKIIDSARRPDLLPLIIAGGEAVHAMLTKRKDPHQALGPIAERIRNGVQNPTNQPQLTQVLSTSQTDLHEEETDDELHDLYPQWRQQLREEIPEAKASIVFSVLFQQESNAHVFASAMLQAGFWVALRAYDNRIDDFEWDVRVQTRLRLTRIKVNTFQDMLSSISGEDDGFVNGWRSLGVRQSRYPGP